MSWTRTTIFIFVLIIGGCATHQPPPNPFKIPEAEFRSRVKTIALAPLVLPDGVEQPDAVKAKFESLVDAKLHAQGFTVIPSKEYESVWKQMTAQLGGYFDPVTGKKDETKFKAVRSHSLREMGAKYKADAVLHSAVLPVQARFTSNMAHWDGTSESVLKTAGGLQSLLYPQRQGNVGALSFAVMIEDANEVMLFTDRGGIQLLHKLSGSSFVPVPADELFKDDERMSEAVDFALDALSSKPTPTQAQGK